ncbi:ribbon-helix-helix protein, CopG family [Methylobacterium sp. E-046]|uniref:ribbon-helix-helix protein, CopG family n=1 Tax=Methylobacterium sp. E-046 TaxID=2836576 RepID=UPI001FBAC187|nr:ribbon-helix-helix protein, CopG family [Methylobacterium sp. E-046]MCJ2101019.1 ribbon-helix-helix protein, CopG family [Methylobacterium sp. E-046]
MDKVAVPHEIDEFLLERLEARARQLGLSRDQLMEKYIREWIDAKRREVRQINLTRDQILDRIIEKGLNRLN